MVGVIGVILPISAWQSFIDFFGLGPMPEAPIIGYLVRLMSALFVGIGVFFAILALNPTKYQILVPFSGVAAVILGLICGITGFVEKLPNLWFLGDALTALVLGALILFFWKKAKQTSESSNEEM